MIHSIEMELPGSSAASENKLSVQPLLEWWNWIGPRAVTSLLVLAPPLVASSLVSDAFFSASDLAVRRYLQFCSILRTVSQAPHL